MDIVDYSSKLDTLYELLANKVNVRKKEKEEEKIKYDTVITQNNELINRVKYLEKNVELLKYFVNILYIPHLNNEHTMEDFIFKNKFKLLTNSNYKKKPISDKIIRGKIDSKHYHNTKKIIIRTTKKICDNISFITLTFYNNTTLINTYTFNHLLQVKKYDDYCIEVISDIIDCSKFNNYIIEEFKKTNLIKVNFFRIDEFYDIINNFDIC